PVVIGDHDHAVTDRQYPAYPGHLLSRGRMQRLDLAAEDRALHESRVQHARQDHVDPIDGAPVDLARGIEAREAAADDAEFLRRLPHDLLGHRLLGGRGGEFTVGEAVAARVEDLSLTRATL